MLFRRIVLLAMLSGIFSGFVYSIYQTIFILPVINQAEILESTLSGNESLQTHINEHEIVHTGSTRLVEGFIANALLSFSLGLLLLGGMTLHYRYLSRKMISWRKSLCWGISIWIVLYGMPVLAGLLPQLPGTGSKAVADRQLYWLVAAVSGLVFVLLITYGHGMQRFFAFIIPVGLLTLTISKSISFPGFSGIATDLQLASLQHQFIPLTALGTFILCICASLISGYCYRRWLATLAAP
jgi:predicted cobalt transporter CbtA